VCVHVCIRVCVCVCVYVCAYVCVFVCVCERERLCFLGYVCCDAMCVRV